MYPDITLSAKTWLDKLFKFFSFLKHAMLCCVFGMRGYLLLKWAYDSLMIKLPSGVAHLLQGISSVVEGITAIGVGLALLPCGGLSLVIGVACLLTGAASVAFGANEIYLGATGVNTIQDLFGMSDRWYNIIYTGVTIATAICTAVGVAYGNMTGWNCFIAGTQVVTKDGNKNIEDIQVGDLVLAYDEETGEQEYKKVVRLFRNETKCWCTVSIKPENGGESFEIVSTPGHKYFLPDNEESRDFGKPLEHSGYAKLSEKWISAESLKQGDKVLLSDGSYGIIQSVEVTRLAVPETTYNFEVEDFHTYYVGENGVCVHNADCGVGGKGWEGDKDWRDNVKTVGRGGDILELKGGVPTQTQAEKLVMQAKGTLLRAENAHIPPNPHTFPHINYVTSIGKKGIIKLSSVIPKIYG